MLKKVEKRKVQNAFANLLPMIVYTDGGAAPNPGPGGYAVVWVEGGRRKTVVGGERYTTNNRMELKAIECALRKPPRDRHLVIYSDSRYAIDALTKWRFGWERRGWKTREGKLVLNLDLLQTIIKRIEARGGKVKFIWVKGHAGNRMNELVDRLANGRARAGGRRSAVRD